MSVFLETVVVEVEEVGHVSEDGEVVDDQKDSDKIEVIKDQQKKEVKNDTGQIVWK